MSEPAEQPQPITLSIWTPDGEQHDTVLPGPGGTVRFCVGDPAGDQSAMWRVWSPRNTSDVYIAVRDIAGEQKFSLHESGDWRHQFLTKEHARAHGFESRVIDQWDQPAEHGDSRITLGFTVRVRSQDLASYPPRAGSAKDVVWLPAAPDGKATVVHVVISRLHDMPVEFRRMVPFEGFSLRDGRAVLLMVALEDVAEAMNTQLDGLISGVAQQIDFTSIRAPRMLLHGYNEHGRLAWDVAIRPPQAASPTEEVSP